MENSYVFILSLIDYQDKYPVEIIPNHFLQRASKEQITEIKEIIDQFNSYPTIKYPYEYSIKHVYDENKKQTTINRTALDEDKWNYWIISFSGTNDKIENLKTSLLLQEIEIELGFTVFSYGMSYQKESLLNFYSRLDFSNVSLIKIDNNDILKIQNTYNQITELDKEYTYIASSLVNFNILNHIPMFSEMYIIGLFSIIESLITHKPKLLEFQDSLSHQISTKMNLLGKRFYYAPNYGAYFVKNTDTEKIWKKLYEYRSKIVHGDPIKFNSDLKVLKDKKNVREFLREIVKLLLIYATNEPLLLTDLKKC